MNGKQDWIGEGWEIEGKMYMYEGGGGEGFRLWADPGGCKRGMCPLVNRLWPCYISYFRVHQWLCPQQKVKLHVWLFLFACQLIPSGVKLFFSFNCRPKRSNLYTCTTRLSQNGVIVKKHNRDRAVLPPKCEKAPPPPPRAQITKSPCINSVFPVWSIYKGKLRSYNVHVEPCLCVMK